MGVVHVKYTLNGKVVSNDEVEKHRILFDPRCFNSKQKTDAILRLRQLDHDVVLFIDEKFNLTIDALPD